MSELLRKIMRPTRRSLSPRPAQVLAREPTSPRRADGASRRGEAVSHPLFPALCDDTVFADDLQSNRIGGRIGVHADSLQNPGLFVARTTAESLRRRISQFFVGWRTLSRLCARAPLSDRRIARLKQTGVCSKVLSAHCCCRVMRRSSRWLDFALHFFFNAMMRAVPFAACFAAMSAQPLAHEQRRLFRPSTPRRKNP